MATGGILGYAESDSEDELPCGWEERVNPDGKVYYCSHNDRKTQWTHPRTGKRKRVTGDLPPGWNATTDDKGNQMFVNHREGKSTHTDPRLAFAVEDVQTNANTLPRQKYDASTKVLKHSDVENLCGDFVALAILHGIDLEGKTVLITGANTGIGFETARSLALHNAHVVMACRNVNVAGRKRNEILAEKATAIIDVVELDLASLKSVQKCARQFLLSQWPLHILILNAGTFADAYERTEDGLEKTFQVNHLVLLSSAPGRVVVLSSESHRRATMLQKELCGPACDLSLEHLSPSTGSKYWYLHAYNVSKFCNNCFAFALNKRLQPKGVVVNAVHPGNMISTDLARKSCFMKVLFTLVRPFTKSLQQGAATTVLCAVSPEYENVGGVYFNNCCACPPHDQTLDSDMQERIWTISDDIINLFEAKCQLQQNNETC